MSEKRYIPVDVRRYLRQEASFGCCYCGAAILDYHHIIPWKERHHNEVEHMVAVCPTHHRMFHTMGRDQQYAIKQAPKNKRSGAINGLLWSAAAQPVFVMGTNRYINTPIIFDFYGLPIIQYRLMNGQYLVSAYIPKSDFWPELRIIDNDLIANTGNAWDIEFRSNYLKFVRSDKKQYFEIDLRQDEALVAASLQIGGIDFHFDHKTTSFGNAMITNCQFENCGGGLSYGDGKSRLLIPNFAMSHPVAVFHR